MSRKIKVLLALAPILFLIGGISWLLYTPKGFRNSIGMEFVHIPAGDFIMGDLLPNGQGNALQDAPMREVRLSYDYYIQATEVTQAQWRAVMNDNPSHYQGDLLLPVDSVSHEEITLFLAWLNRKENKGIYRLPTEAEWEYAARAGNPSAFVSGNDARALDPYAWHKGNSEFKTHPVAQKKPNAWGIFDMHGNVYEWVQDWYDNYPEGPAQNPLGPETGLNRVMRGGSFMFPPSFARYGRRHSGRPFLKNRGVGLRLVWTAQ